MKISLVTLTVLSALVSGQAFAGASANIGVTSNYMWRGMTQTQDDPAIQGGLDYSHDSGWYVGTWASNSKFSNKSGAEVDLYTGYKKELKGGVSYDVGVTKYFYPSDNSVQFTEAYLKGGYKGVGAEVDYTLGKDGNNNGKEHDLYYAVGYTGKLKNDWSYGAKVGRYDFKEPATGDYTHGQISVTKSLKKAGDFTLALDKANGGAAKANNGDNDLRASVSWKKNFDF